MKQAELRVTDSAWEGPRLPLPFLAFPGIKISKVFIRRKREGTKNTIVEEDISPSHYELHSGTGIPALQWNADAAIPTELFIRLESKRWLPSIPETVLVAFATALASITVASLGVVGSYISLTHKTDLDDYAKIADRECGKDNGSPKCLTEKVDNLKRGHDKCKEDAAQTEASFAAVSDQIERLRNGIWKQSFPCSTEDEVECAQEIAFARDKMALALGCPADRDQLNCIDRRLGSTPSASSHSTNTVATGR